MSSTILLIQNSTKVFDFTHLEWVAVVRYKWVKIKKKNTSRVNMTCKLDILFDNIERKKKVFTYL